MNSAESKQQAQRVFRYRELEERRSKLAETLRVITEGASPFTGNTRESRRVVSAHIKFSATRGGADPVDMFIELDVEACDLGRAITELIKARIEVLDKAIEEI